LFTKKPLWAFVILCFLGGYGVAMVMENSVGGPGWFHDFRWTPRALDLPADKCVEDADCLAEQPVHQEEKKVLLAHAAIDDAILHPSLPRLPAPTILPSKPVLTKKTAPKYATFHRGYRIPRPQPSPFSAKLGLSSAIALGGTDLSAYSADIGAIPLDNLSDEDITRLANQNDALDRTDTSGIKPTPEEQVSPASIFEIIPTNGGRGFDLNAQNQLNTSN